MPVNRSPWRLSTRASWTVWSGFRRNRALCPSGEATWPTWSVTFPPKPWTSPSKTSTRRSSLVEWIRKHSSGATLLATWHPVVPLVQPLFASSTLSTSPEQGWLLTLVKAQLRESSLVWETASAKSSKQTALRVFTLDSTCLSRALSFTEQPTLDASTQPKVRIHALGGNV